MTLLCVSTQTLYKEHDIFYFFFAFLQTTFPNCFVLKQRIYSCDNNFWQNLSKYFRQKGGGGAKFCNGAVFY